MKYNHLKIGEIGETAVLHHLKRKGFLCVERNFKAKTGEIDLILEREGKIHFIEVKSVSRGIYTDYPLQTVSHGTYRPEDNVHREKLRRILNTIQIWISLNKHQGSWQLDVAAVKLDEKTGKGLVRMIENVILE